MTHTLFNQGNIKHLLLQAFILFFAVMITLSAVDVNLIKPAPSINGVTDLRQADLLNHIYDISGSWRFSRNTHEPMSPSENYSQVPALFSLEEGKCLSFSTTLYLKDAEQLLSLRIGNVRMAYELYADGKLISKSGKLATETSRAISYNVPKVTSFQPQSEVVQLTFIVDNDYYNTTGILEPLLIGSPEKISYRQMQLNILDLVLIIGFLLSALYYTVLYIHNPQEKSQLYFAFYALLYGFIVASGYQKILLQLYPNISFEWMIFIRTIANQLALLLICLYYRVLHPKLISLKLVLFVGLCQLIQDCLYIFLEPQAYWQLDRYFFLVQLLLLGYIGYQMLHFIKLQYIGTAESKTSHYNLDLLILLIMHLCLFANYFVYTLYNSAAIHSQAAGFSFLVVFLFLNIRLLAVKYTLVNIKVSHINQELERTLAYRDAFIAQTAHDLIVPVENISTLAESLVKDSPQLTAELKSPLRDLQLMSSQLAQEIRAIMSQAHIQIEHSSLNIRAVNLLSVLRYSLSLRQMSLTKDYIRNHFGTEKSLYVWADEDKLIQCLLHLLTYQMRWYQQLIFSIDHIDVQSITLKLSHQPNLQSLAAATSRPQPGSNQLELSIVEFLLHQMNASMQFGPADANGWRDCYLNLPRAFDSDLHSPVLTPHSSNPVAASKGTLLLVNHNEQSIIALVTALKSAGYTVIKSQNGAEALSLLELHKPDLVIIDAILEDMTGTELSLKLRKRFQINQLPILLMFYRHFDKEINIGLSSGMNDYLVKPIAVDEALLKIEGLLAYKKNSENLFQAEVAFWQSQIKPHFIYNALNVITSLIYEKPDYAAELLADFGNYLRMSIDNDAKEMYIPISKEVALIKSYVAIERARFGDRLKLSYAIDESILDVHLPALLIEPLVENAVKHGVLKRIEGGTVTLIIEKRDATLYVCIVDDGIGMSEETLALLLRDRPESQSIGIKNVHKRLCSLYGSGLSIKSTPKEGTQVWFNIPLTLLGGRL